MPGEVDFSDLVANGPGGNMPAPAAASSVAVAEPPAQSPGTVDFSDLVANGPGGSALTGGATRAAPAVSSIQSLEPGPTASEQTPEAEEPGTEEATPTAATPEPTESDSLLSTIQKNVIAGAMNARAAVWNVPKGFMELPESAVNIARRMYQGSPFQQFAERPNNLGITRIAPMLNQYVSDINTAMGRSAEAPLDISGAYGQWSGANQAAQQYPIAGQIGETAGGMFVPLGSLGKVAEGVPAVVKGIWSGAQVGSIVNALDEAGQQIKSGKPLDWEQIMHRAEMGSLMGAGLGVAGETISKAMGHVLRGLGRAKRLEILRAKRVIQADERAMRERRIERINNAMEAGRQVAQKLRAEYLRARPTPEVERPPLTPFQKAHAEALAKRQAEMAEVDRMAREREENIANARWQGIFGPVTETPKQVGPNKFALAAEKEEIGPKSFRGVYAKEAVPATPEQAELLKPVVDLKLAVDIADAKATSAAKQLAKSLGVRRTYKSVLNAQEQLTITQFYRQKEAEGRAEVKSYAQEFSVRFAEPIKAKYKFENQTLEGKEKETIKLIARHNYLDGEYRNAKEAVRAQAPQGVVSVSVGNRVALVANKTVVHEWSLKDTEAIAQRDQLRAELLSGAARRPVITSANLDAALADHPDMKERLRDGGVLSFIRQMYVSGNRSAAVFDPISLTAHTFGTVMRVMKQRDLVPEKMDEDQVLVRTARAIKEAKLPMSQKRSPRIWQRVTFNETVSNVIRKMDPAFAWNRDGYLEARKQAISGGREAKAAEREIIHKLARPEDILTTPLLQGWTKVEREKEFRGLQLDKMYLKMVRDKLAQLERLGVAPAKSTKSLWGLPRLRRMIEWDLYDLTGGSKGEPSPVGSLYEQVMNSLYVSLFTGRWPTHYLHGIETLMTQVSGHPILAGKALQLATTDAQARKFADAMTGRGMMESLKEGPKLPTHQWVNEHINDPLAALIDKNVPYGKLGRQVLSGDIAERMKTGLTAVVASEKVAQDLKYPGGAHQLRADYLANLEGRAIAPSRQVAQAQSSIEMFRYMNNTLFHMPEGPIKERTVFQRHSMSGAVFPFLRSVVLQANVLTKYLDDATEALLQKNVPKAARALGSLILAHTIIAVWAGKNSLPSYLWVALDAVDKPDANKLREAFDLLNKSNAYIGMGGRHIEEVGPEYLPFLRGGNLALSVAIEHLKLLKDIADVGNPKKRAKAADELALLTGLLVADNFAYVEGTQNIWTFLKNVVGEGTAGKRLHEYWTHPNFVQRYLLGIAPKRLLKHFEKSNWWEGLKRWLLPGTPRKEYEEEEKALERASHKKIKVPSLRGIHGFKTKIG